MFQSGCGGGGHLRCCWGNLSWPKHLGRRRQWHPTPVLLPGKSHGRRGLVGCSPWGHEESDTTERLPFTFHFHALEKEMATHSSILAWRIPGMGESGGLSSLGSQSWTWWKRLSSSSSSSSKPLGTPFGHIRQEWRYIYTLTLLVPHLHMSPEETLAHLHRTHARMLTAVLFIILKSWK